MKATIEFNLPEEDSEFKACAKARDLASFVWELVHNGWRVFKHTDYDYEKAWNRIHELLEEYDINVEDFG